MYVFTHRFASICICTNQPHIYYVLYMQPLGLYICMWITIVMGNNSSIHNLSFVIDGTFVVKDMILIITNWYFIYFHQPLGLHDCVYIQQLGLYDCVYIQSEDSNIIDCHIKFNLFFIPRYRISCDFMKIVCCWGCGWIVWSSVHEDGSNLILIFDSWWWCFACGKLRDM